MPTYKNTSSVRVTLSGFALEPGQSMELDGYVINAAGKGLTETAVTPYYNPVIHSEKVSTSKTVQVPEVDSLGNNVERYLVHFYTSSDWIGSINFNDASNDPALLLYGDAKWNIRCFSRLIDNIIITRTAGDVWVIIEKI